MVGTRGAGVFEFNALRAMPATLLITSFKRYVPLGGAGSSYFRPERRKIPSISVALPAGAFDAVRVEYSVCYQRADDGGKYTVRIGKTREGSYDVDALAKLEGDQSPSCPKAEAVEAI